MIVKLNKDDELFIEPETEFETIIIDKYRNPDPQAFVKCGTTASEVLGLVIKKGPDLPISPVSRGEYHHDTIVRLLVDAVITDGSYYKQWFLEEIAKCLGITLPEHEKGVAP